MGLLEIEEAANLIRQAADPDANIFFGADTDDTLEDEVRITVIATGFDAVKRPRPAVREELKQPGELEFGFDSANDDEDLFVDVKARKEKSLLSENLLTQATTLISLRSCAGRKTKVISDNICAVMP